MEYRDQKNTFFVSYNDHDNWKRSIHEENKKEKRRESREQNANQKKMLGVGSLDSIRIAAPAFSSVSEAVAKQPKSTTSLHLHCPSRPPSSPLSFSLPNSFIFRAKPSSQRTASASFRCFSGKAIYPALNVLL